MRAAQFSLRCRTDRESTISSQIALLCCDSHEDHLSLSLPTLGPHYPVPSVHPEQIERLLLHCELIRF